MPRQAIDPCLQTIQMVSLMMCVTQNLRKNPLLHQPQPKRRIQK